MIRFTIDNSDFLYESKNIASMFFEGITTKAEESADFIDIKTENFFEVNIKYDGEIIYKKIEMPKFEVKTDAEMWIAKEIFTLLCEKRAVRPPFGLLTGIRPVKKVLELQNKGVSNGEIDNFLKETYLAKRDKRELLFKTAENQRDIINSVKENEFSLYISVPFCPSRCNYCSFVSTATERESGLIEKYHELLLLDIKKTAQVAKELNLKLKSVYIGGGTPTTFSAQMLREVTKTVNENFDLSNLVEYSCEAGRPDTIDEEKLTALKEGGVTRISINTQSTDNKTLQRIGRNHTAQQFEESFMLARKVGFDVINTDLIAGLVGESEEEFLKSVRDVISLAPENITVHTLTVKRASNLTIDGGDSFDPHRYDVVSMIEKSRDMLYESGYLPFYLYRQKNTVANAENVGYCKEGKQSYYNIVIMEECQSILACGANGVTKLFREENERKIERVYANKYPTDYINNFDEMLKRKDRIVEFLNNRK